MDLSVYSIDSLRKKNLDSGAFRFIDKIYFDEHKFIMLPTKYWFDCLVKNKSQKHHKELFIIQFAFGWTKVVDTINDSLPENEAKYECITYDLLHLNLQKYEICNSRGNLIGNNHSVLAKMVHRAQRLIDEIYQNELTWDITKTMPLFKEVIRNQYKYNCEIMQKYTDNNGNPLLERRFDTTKTRPFFK